MHARLAEVQVAIMMLSRLPAGHLAGKAPTLKEARWAFPWVGALIALPVWAVHASALSLGGAPLIANLLALTTLVFVTGALHFDGLADMADGLGGGRDRSHCLEIMRDSRIGSYGVLALVLCCGLWVAALQQLGPIAFGLFAVVSVTSRAMMVLLLERLAPARDDGLGHMASGQTVAGTISILVALVVAIAWSGIPGLIVIGTCLAVTAFIGWCAWRRIGGHTGDVLGAAQVSSETMCWVALSFWLA